jgi:CelD/BcsL family acetyltransferase involved in cellulose biosynthesis
MSDLSVEIVGGNQALTEMRAEWQALFEVTTAPPFLSWEWVSTWNRWFGQEKDPFIFCARDEGRLVGLLALGEEKKKASLISPAARSFSFLGGPEGAPDYLDILALPGYEQKCAVAIFERLAALDLFDLLELEGIAADSPTLPMLALRFGDNRDYKYQIIPQYACPQMKLEGSWEEILSGTSRHDYFNRCVRRLNKVKGYEFRVVSDPSEVKASFARFLELHEGRWKDRGSSAATSSPELIGFMGDAAYEMARAGMMRFEEIWLEGECRASLFGFEAGETHYFYLSGFDQAWSKYSLGFVILGISIQGAAQRGLKRYDFLRGAETYKFFWANHTALTVSAKLIGKSRAARLSMAQTSAEEIARALIPEKIKLLRRRLRQNSGASPTGASGSEQKNGDGTNPEKASELKPA